MSFYKMFGMPTGLGALVARRGAAAELSRHRTYFGGGTVRRVDLDSPVGVLHGCWMMMGIELIYELWFSSLFTFHSFFLDFRFTLLNRSP